MKRKSLTALALGLSLALSGCAATPGGSNTETPAPTQTFDPALIPTAPAEDALAVDPQVFDAGYGEYTFRIGDGPTWCTINGESKFVICEQNEADATYEPLTAPTTCKLSIGYQIKLWSTKPEKGSISEFPCASGLYADPSSAQTLNTGETLTVAGITCFTSELTARCDNESGNYVVLGPEVWALG